MATGANILIVDDEPIILCMLAMRLRDHGYTVLTARNGHEAFLIARESQVDLVISDLQMPITDGLQLARQLFAEAATAALPVVLLTARSHKLNPSDLKSTSVRQVLAKPFSAKELISLIDELLVSESRGSQTDMKRQAA